VWCTRCGTAMSAIDRFCPGCGQANPARPESVPNAWQVSETEALPVLPGAFLAARRPFAGPPAQPPSRTRGLVTALAVVGLLMLASMAAAVGWKLVSSAGHRTAAQPAKLSLSPTISASVTMANPQTTAAAASASATPSPGDFAALYARASSGVVRIETVGCSEQGVGTGFLLSPTIIATVNHVVADSAVVSLIAGEQRTTCTVIGADPSTDLALVRVNRSLTGYHFRLATAAPAIGSRVAAEQPCSAATGQLLQPVRPAAAGDPEPARQRRWSHDRARHRHRCGTQHLLRRHQQRQLLRGVGRAQPPTPSRDALRRLQGRNVDQLRFRILNPQRTCHQQLHRTGNPDLHQPASSR